MTIRSRGKSGEAVMLVIMGAMIVGGIVVWLEAVWEQNADEN
jgi:hypothetical protein